MGAAAPLGRPSMPVGLPERAGCPGVWLSRPVDRVPGADELKEGGSQAALHWWTGSCLCLHFSCARASESSPPQATLLLTGWLFPVCLLAWMAVQGGRYLPVP